MHLLRIKVKPHPQSRPSLGAEQIDPLVTGPSRSRTLAAEQQRVRRSVWESLPFVKRVSDTTLYIRFLLNVFFCLILS